MDAPADILDIEDFRMDSQKQESIRYFDYRRLLRKALTANEYLVFDILVDMANDEDNDGWCWPGYTEISERAGELAPATINNAIDRLEALALIQVQRPTGKLNRAVANRYKPLKAPIDGTNEVLQRAYEARIASKNEAKLHKNNRFKNCIASKIETDTLQKLKSNVSKRTDPINKTYDSNESYAAGAAFQEVKKGKVPLVNFLNQAYQEAQAGKGPRNHKSRDTAELLEIAFEMTFCRSPSTGRLLAMAGPSQLNSGWALIELILSLTKEQIMDDPHDYLQRAISQHKEAKLKLNGVKRGPYPSKNGGVSSKSGPINFEKYTTGKYANLTKPPGLLE